ncbi:MAG: type II toxin-antitoxin system death-on-curing family toxin [Dehalococcoidia bacterium]
MRPANGERGEGATQDLTLTQVLSFYADLFDCTIQQAQDQLRSRDGLESALARPQFYAHYQEADLSQQAAVLAHGIAETQPFIEGNKRTALASMLTFLALNGFEVAASGEECAAWMLSLSAGATAEDLAERIRAALVPA